MISKESYRMIRPVRGIEDKHNFLINGNNFFIGIFAILLAAVIDGVTGWGFLK